MQTKPTFLFYDIETTGLNKSFDQVVQFAAIRTDEELNELERHEILFQLNPDIIPAPQSLITHNIALSDLEKGICEYEAICQVHRLLNKPGTISLGYNSLGFDDEFLRFSFYRNLLPPYTHQYANNCGRMDIYPIVVMYYLFKNEALRWPEIDNKNSLKLEHLNNSNQLINGVAHNAMVDVEVTLELARRLIVHRDMWNYICNYFVKNLDQERIQKLRTAVMVDGVFGADNRYQVMVLALGQHWHYKNQTIWLRLDNPELSSINATNIQEVAYCIVRKKAGESGLLLPPSSRFLNNFTQERANIVEENTKWLANNPKILDAIKNYYLDYKYPVVSDIDIDAALYQAGFWSDYEQRLAAEFHKLIPSQKETILPRLKHTRLFQQALRIIGRNYPDYLPEEYGNEFAKYLQRVNTKNEDEALIDYKNQKRMTIPKALREIKELMQKNNLSVRQVSLLQDLESYLLFLCH